MANTTNTNKNTSKSKSTSTTKKTTSGAKKTTTTSKKSTSSKSKSTTLQKELTKSVKKYAKKNPKGAAKLSFVLIVLIILGFFGYKTYKYFYPDQVFTLNGPSVMSIGLNGSGYLEKGAKAYYGKEDITDKIQITYHKDEKTSAPVDDIKVDELATYYVEYSISYEKMEQTKYRTVKVVDVAEMSIYFMELGNHHTGDSTYIKAGDVDILIDAGSTQSSASYLYEELTKEGMIEDGRIEYLVVTHAHFDHIAGLVGSKKDKGLLERFEYDNIFQFANSNSETATYKNYVSMVNSLKEKGTNVKTAKELVDSSDVTFELAPGISMNILDQKYYHESCSNENNYSLCTLFTQGSNNYLFTGDLEQDGEDSLVSLNTLPEVELFKAGHHGSPTANGETLLDVIKPQNVCVCCCAGNDEYTSNKDTQFPGQETINRIAKYTDKIYVTTVSTDGKSGYTSMNGRICFYSRKGQEYEIHGSNNDLILKETDWFKANRTWPVSD